MKKPKLLTTRMSIRRSSAGALREYLDELEAKRAAGDMRDVVYDTYLYALGELERRGLQRTPPQQRTLIKQSLVYRLTAGKLRTMMAELLLKSDRSGIEQDTLEQLLREEQRRKDHNRYVYLKRKEEAACSTLSSPSSSTTAPSTSASAT